MLPFFAILSFVTALMVIAVGRHLWVPGTPEAIPGWIGLAFLWIAILLALPIRRLAPPTIARPIQWIGYVSLATLSLLLGVTAIGAILFSALGWRQDFDKVRVRSAVELAIAAGLLLDGIYVAQRPRLREVRVPLKGLPEAFNGYCIVQVSDFHLGETLGRAFAEMIVSKVNARAPDLIAVTGDIAEGSVHEVGSQVEPFGKLRATDGAYYVTGNHEYFHGGPQWEAHMRGLGITTLHNQHKVLRRGEALLVIAGVPDFQAIRYNSGNPSVEEALAGAPSEATTILLAHQPSFAKFVPDGLVALMLSGHTHAGQIFPFQLIVRLAQPVLSGLKRINGVLTYTSPGTGYWGPPVRVFARGEISVLTLVSA